MSKQHTSLKTMAEDKTGKDKTAEGVGKNTGFNVDPYVIQIEPGFNRPITRSIVESFKLSMKHGATIPEIALRVEDGIIWMVDGEHRLIAVKELNEDAEYIAEHGRIDIMRAFHFRGDEEDRTFHMIQTANENPISMLVKGEKMMPLIKKGRSMTYIANRIGCSTSYVADCLLLVESRDNVKDQIRAGVVSDTTAVAVIKEHGSKSAEVIAVAQVEAAKTGKTRVTAKHIVGLKPKTLESAIREEMESGGTVRAETIIPKHAELIAYLRGSGSIIKVA